MQLRAILGGYRGNIKYACLRQAERLRDRERLIDKVAVRSDQIHMGSQPE